MLGFLKKIPGVFKKGGALTKLKYGAGIAVGIKVLEYFVPGVGPVVDVVERVVPIGEVPNEIEMALSNVLAGFAVLLPWAVAFFKKESKAAVDNLQLKD